MSEMNLNFEDVEFDDFCEEVQAENDDPLEAMAPAKKSMVLFFVIDVSASMRGERINTMNQVMRDVLPELIGVGESTTEIKVAVLAFGSGFEWITPEPMILEEYQRWRDLEAEGVTDLGAALQELNQKMSRKSFLQSPSLSYAPVVFMITDGCPTDNYKAGITALRSNNWFKHGIKIALALGNGVDMDVLEEFTGDREFVVKANNLKEMTALVRAISVTSSQIGSKSMPVGESNGELDESSVEGSKQEQMREALKDLKADIMSESGDYSFDVDEGW